MNFENRPRDISTYAPPGVKCGRGGVRPSPLKSGNPAPSFIGPWLILPLAIAAWGVLGILGALVLHLIGGGA